MAESEAAHVEELYQLATGFPEPERGEIQEIVVFYARVVVEEEWPLMGEGLSQLDELDEGRALRLLEVREGLPPILWAVLIVGGVLTVSFTYLFGMETSWLHMLAVAALAMIVALTIYSIAVLDFPFNSDLRVGPEAFELVLRRIEGD
jgi:hypothetical protein